MKCSTSYTLTHVKDGANAHSYVLSATMSASASGTLSVTVYKDGAVNTSSLYLYAQHMAIGSTSWTQSGITGVITGTASSSYSSVKCFKLELWDSSSKTEMLASSFVSFGQNGANGSDGNDGVGISSMVEYFGVSSSASTAPTQWKTRSEMPSMTPINKFLWSYTYTTFTDGSHSGSSSSAIIIGVYGDSVGITSITYGVSSSASTEPSSWSSTMPVASQTDYLWTKTTFSDGSVMKSYTYQSVDGDSFTETIQYGMTSALDTAPTEYNMDTSEWRKGLYVYKRITRTRSGEEQGTIVSNVYDPETQKQLMSTVRFSMEPEVDTWEKSRRKPTVLTIPIKTVIEGYGRAKPTFINVPSGVTVNKLYSLTGDDKIYPEKTYYTLTGGVYVAVQSPIIDDIATYYEDTGDYSLSFSNNINLSEITITAVINYTGVSDSVAFTINSITIPERAIYLGKKSSLPTETDDGGALFVGDHFVASQTFTDTGVQYDKFMPYVLTANGWDRPYNGQDYNGVSTNQILYDSARDIFTNANWVYNGPLPSGSTAQAGVNYYSESDGTYSPVAVPAGESVQGMYTRQREIPAEVANYYNYQESMLSTYIGTNDIELVKEGDKIGSVRSTGYSRGTVAEMNRTGSDVGFEKGFYLGGDGQFEAYKAELYKADMFEATVHGKLDAATLQTETSPQTGTAVDDNDITQGTKHWDVAEAIQTIRGVSGWEDNKVKDLSTTLSGTQRTKAMYVSNPSATGTSGTKAAGATFTMPIQAVANITGKFYDSNDNEVVSGSIVNGGTVLTNKARWNISDLYNNGSISANSVLSASGSWKSYSISWLAKVTNVSNTAYLANTSGTCPNNYDTNDDVTVYTVPSWVKTSVNVTISGVSKYVFGVFTWGAQRRTQWIWGNVEVYINGSKKYTSIASETETQSSFNNYANWSTTQTVKGGDVIRIKYYQRNQYKTIASVYSSSYGTWNISGSSSFTSQGMSSNGLWVFYSSSWHNLGTDTEYLQNSNYISLTSPVAWSSSSNVYTASLTYDYSLYSAGLNLLNASTYASEAVLNTGVTSSVFSASYGGTVRVNTANGTGVTLLYKYRGLTQASGSVFAVSSSRFSFTRGDGTSLPQVTNVTAITWDSSSITVSIASGAVFSFSQSASSNKADYLSAFDLYFVPLARALGNYTRTIYPMDNETDRTEEINLGSLGNRFDGIYSKEVGARSTPIKDIYANNGMIKNVNLIPVTVTAFEQGLTYYYFNYNGVLTAETAGTPASGRQYFLLNTGGYGHFDVLSMLDAVDSQRKRIDELFVKISRLQHDTDPLMTSNVTDDNHVPTSQNVKDAIMNISAEKIFEWDLSYSAYSNPSKSHSIDFSKYRFLRIYVLHVGSDEGTVDIVSTLQEKLPLSKFIFFNGVQVGVSIASSTINVFSASTLSLKIQIFGLK